MPESCIGAKRMGGRGWALHNGAQPRSMLVDHFPQKKMQEGNEKKESTFKILAFLVHIELIL